MDDAAGQLLEQLVQRVREHELSRSDFAKMLAGMGASASGIAMLLESASNVRAAQTGSVQKKRGSHTTAHRHKQLHHHHVQRQGRATRAPLGSGKRDDAEAVESSVHEFRAQKLNEIMADYADNAVVEDPLLNKPIVGKRAIAQRKMAEMVAMQGVTIDVVHRFSHNNQVVAEWLVRGTHQGPFMGFAPTGRSIELRGMTVVTREDEKITKESLFYDVSELHRQLD